MNDAWAVKVLTGMIEVRRANIAKSGVDEDKQTRRELQALSCAIRRLTEPRGQARKKTPKYVARA